MARIDKKLVKASEKGDTKEVEDLLAQGANVHYQSLFGVTAWGNAAREGHTEILRLLLDAGVEINGQNKFGGTPLWVSAGNARTDTVRMLIEKGADIDMKAGPDDSTALIRAVIQAADLDKESEYLGVVEALLEAGADGEAANDSGITAKAIAETIKLPSILSLLAKHAE